MKKFAVPLQALASIGICLGMAWMIFVVAGFNPTPPNSTDLQARNPQGLSFASMNSTAVALAQDMIADWLPSPVVTIAMPVTGGTTVTPGPLAIVTLRAVSTLAATPTPKPWYSFLLPTKKSDDSDPVPPTFTLAPTKTLMPSKTPSPLPTATRKPSRTPPPTATMQPVTLTPVPPTATPKPLESPTTDPTTTTEEPTHIPTETTPADPPTAETPDIPTGDPDPLESPGTPTE